MSYRYFFVAIAAVAVASDATAQNTEIANGTAIVKVVTEPPGGTGSFVFTGVPDGVISAGESLSETGLSPETYSSRELGTTTQSELVRITCDDDDSKMPSNGDVQSRTATFRIDAGETVTCEFYYVALTQAGTGSGVPTGSAVPPGSGVPTGSGMPPGSGVPTDSGELCEPPGGVNQFENPPSDYNEFPLPASLPVSAGSFAVPKAGSWNVSNLPGSMVCIGPITINKELKPSQESGSIEVRDCGRTLVGTGLSDDTAPITMRAVEDMNGRYTGSVGGVQDSIPMTIDFVFQLVTDEWITGYLKSEISQQGMTCNMSRPVELRYEPL